MVEANYGVVDCKKRVKVLILISIYEFIQTTYMWQAHYIIFSRSVLKWIWIKGYSKYSFLVWVL